MAMRGLRPGELVPTPQPAGPARGVVSLEAVKWASRDQTSHQPGAPFESISPPKCENSSLNLSALENHAPAQRFPRFSRGHKNRPRADFNQNRATKFFFFCQQVLQGIPVEPIPPMRQLRKLGTLILEERSSG